MNDTNPAILNKNFSSADNASMAAVSVSAADNKGWMRNLAVYSQPRLSANELVSVTALIAYVAHQAGSTEFRVERNLADHFNVPNVKFLPATQFDSAIRYLVDAFSV